MSADLKPHVCPYCDFGSGQRGMDRCQLCDGTGSVFLVGGPRNDFLVFPNTEEGYKAALAAREAANFKTAEGDVP